MMNFQIINITARSLYPLGCLHPALGSCPTLSLSHWVLFTPQGSGCKINLFLQKMYYLVPNTELPEKSHKKKPNKHKKKRRESKTPTMHVSFITAALLLNFMIFWVMLWLIDVYT